MRGGVSWGTVPRANQINPYTPHGWAGIDEDAAVPNLHVRHWDRTFLLHSLQEICHYLMSASREDTRNEIHCGACPNVLLECPSWEMRLR